MLSAFGELTIAFTITCTYNNTNVECSSAQRYNTCDKCENCKIKFGCNGKGDYSHGNSMANILRVEVWPKVKQQIINGNYSMVVSTQFHGDCFLGSKFCDDLKCCVLQLNAVIQTLCRVRHSVCAQGSFSSRNNWWLWMTYEFRNWTKCMQSHILCRFDGWLNRRVGTFSHRFDYNRILVAEASALVIRMHLKYVNINDELQMFAKFVCAKLENSTIITLKLSLWRARIPKIPFARL